MTARPITTAGSRPRRSTRQSVGRVPRLLLGKGKHKKNAASSLAQSQGRDCEREREHRGRSPHERSNSRTRPSRWEPMQLPAQVQNAELPAERQRLELRRRAMDAARSVGLAPPQPAIMPRSTRVQVQGPRGTCEITGRLVCDVEPAARVRSRGRKRGRVRNGSGSGTSAARQPRRAGRPGALAAAMRFDAACLSVLKSPNRIWLLHAAYVPKWSHKANFNSPLEKMESLCLIDVGMSFQGQHLTPHRCRDRRQQSLACRYSVWVCI